MNSFENVLSDTSDNIQKGVVYVLNNKESLLQGFTLSMGTIFLIMGAVYIISSYLFKKVPCDEKLAIYGYVMGGLYLIGAVALLGLGQETKWGAFLFVLAAGVAFFVRVYGLYLMLGEEGMLCRSVGGSQLWLIMMVLAILNLAGLGKFIV